MTLHVIPVPAHMTPEEAWAEIKTMGELVEYVPSDPRYVRCTWVVIEDDD